MKSTLIAFFVFFSFQVFSQIERIGHSANEIKQEFSEKVITPSTGYEHSNDGSEFFTIVMEGYKDQFYFKNDICIANIIIPTNELVTNKMINYFNENYVVVKQSEYWSSYGLNGKININLTQLENLFYFYYYKP